MLLDFAKFRGQDFVATENAYLKDWRHQIDVPKKTIKTHNFPNMFDALVEQQIYESLAINIAR